MIAGIWLIMLAVMGAIAAARGPDQPKTVFGWLVVVGSLGMGAISGLWGVWGLISSMLNVGWISHWPIYWLTFLASALVQVALGGLLTVRAVMAVADAKSLPRVLGRLVTALSIASALLGVWSIVAAVLFSTSSGAGS